MANPPPTTATPVTEDAFLRDRLGMWNGFTNATTGSVIFMVILLAGLAFFLL
jgi:hypothetical protein